MKQLALILLLSGLAFAQEAAPQSAAPNPAASPTLHHQEQVVVTGTYSAIPMEEADRSVTTLEIGQSAAGYRGFTDVLQQDPALDLQQRVPGMQGDLSVRGSTFEQTLILLNGLRLNDAQTGHNNLDIPFPFASLERIEVMKGAGSTLYGSDAMGGAVNFITASPQYSEVRLGAAMGNFGTNQQNAALSLARQRFTQQLTMTRELSSGFIADRNYRNFAVSAETVLHTPLGRGDILLGLSDRPFGAAGFYGVPVSYPSFERTKGWLAAWKQALGQQTTVDFAYRRHTDVYIYTLTNPAAYENNHLAEYYQASARRYEKLDQTGNLRLYYGADALRERIESTNLGRHTRDQGGIYTAFDARAWRRFSFNAGVREELYSAGRQVFSPSFSGAYWLNSRIKLRVSLSHAFRLPDYTELYYHDPSHTANPDLKPETSWSYEGGVQVTLPANATVDAAIFHHRDANVIDYARPAGATTPYAAGNIQQLNFTGAEISVRWQLPHRQRIALGYAALRGDGARPANTQYLYTFNYAEHNGSATWWNSAYGLDSRFRLSAVKRYGGNPYPLVEWTLGREFRWASPYVQFTNLTDTKYQEISGVSMPGRGVMGGVQLQWRAK